MTSKPDTITIFTHQCINTVVDHLPRLGKRELICLLLFNCNYVVSVWRGFLFLWVLGMGYVILLRHSLSLPYNYFTIFRKHSNILEGKNRPEPRHADEQQQETESCRRRTDKRTDNERQMTSIHI